MREMKDSGVEWIGEVPSTWRVMPLKALFSFGKGLPITKENLVEAGVPVISYGQIHAKWNSGVTTHDNLLRYVNRSYLESNPQSLVQMGDFIMADTSEDREGCGNCAYIDVKDLLFAGYHTIILRSNYNADNKYLAYLFLTDSWRSQIRKSVSGVKLFSISRRILGTVSVLLPDNTKPIVHYLDSKCSQIDNLIQNVQTQIEKLKAYKQSLITEVVTKGIDPTVPMKDSGVDWIGAVPRAWRVAALKYFIDILPGYAFSSNDFDTEGGIPLLRGINVTPNGIRWDDTVYWNKDFPDYLKPYLLQDKDIVVGLDRPWISEGARITRITERDLPALLLQRVCRIRVRHFIDSRWVYLWIASNAFKESLSTETTGISVPHISTKQIGDFIIALPSMEEQKEICDHIDAKCNQIDRLIAIKQSKIEKLEQYKKSLIYEYVTGKKEVRL